MRVAALGLRLRPPVLSSVLLAAGDGRGRGVRLVPSAAPGPVRGPGCAAVAAVGISAPSSRADNAAGQHLLVSITTSKFVTNLRSSASGVRRQGKH